MNFSLKQIYTIGIGLFLLGMILGMAILYSTVIAKPDGGTVLGPTPENPIACRMDAMMCPDGSYVGRTGPNCEFVCPDDNAPRNYPTTPASSPSAEESGSVGIECPSGYYADVANPDDGWQCFQEGTAHTL